MMSNTTDAVINDLVIAAPRKEIVFIEDNVPDMSTLIAGMGADKEVILLDSSKDGLQQMTHALAGRSGIDALHIISHGTEGTVSLGSLQLTSDNLAAHADDLASIRAVLTPGADILLYGCDVGAGTNGAAFVEELARTTGADVAASNDPTGSPVLGGDWTLETRSGAIEAASLFSAATTGDFNGLLAAISSGKKTFGGYDSSTDLMQDGVFKVTGNDGAGKGYDLVGDDMGLYFDMGTGLPSGSFTAYINVALTAPGSFRLTDISAGDIDEPPENHNFTNIRVEGYANGSQVFSSPQPAFNSPGYDAVYDFGLGDNVNKLIDSFRIYFTGDANDWVTAFNFASFTISGASSAPISSNTAPTISGAVAGQAVNDSGNLMPFSGIVFTDPDSGASETVTVKLDSAGKGTFTAASLAASGFSTSDGGLTYTHAAASPAAMQAAIRALVYQPGANHVAPGSTETTTFTITINDGIASPVTNSATTVVATSVNDAPAFTGANTPLNVNQNSAIDIRSLLHASDVDAGQTLTWNAAAAPAHGTLSFSGASAGSAGSDIAPGGTITYIPAAGYAGIDTFTVQVSDGSAAAARTVTVNVAPAQPGAPDLAAGSDRGAHNNDDITNADTLSFSGTSANGDSSSTVRVFVDKNGNGIYDAGVDATGTATVDNGSWTVNGIDVSGFSDNTYKTYAQVTSASGGLSSTRSDALDVTLERTAPAAPNAPVLAAASDSGTSNSDVITKVATPTFTGAAGSVEGGATVNLYDSNGTSLIATTTAAANGSWSVASATLAEGAHTITAKAVDVAGNISAASTGATVVIDRTPPAAHVQDVAFSNDTGSSSTDLVTRNADQIITGTLSAALAADERVEVSLDNGNSWRTAGVDGTGWSLLATLGGSDTLEVRVADAAGNTGSTYAHAYVLDTAAPAAPSTPDLDAASDTGTYNNDDITGTTTPTFSGSAEAGATVTLYDGDTAIGSGTATGGTWHVTSDTVLGQGSHSITARATDLAGNGSAASAALTIQVITDAPTTRANELAFAADTGTSATDLVTRVAAQTVAGTLDTALASGEYVEVSINGGAWQTADADGTGWSLATTLDAGTHPIAVRVTNSIGNSSDAFVRDYTLDTVAPGVTIASSAAQLKAGQGATITFTFSEDPGATFTWDGSAGDVVVRGGTLSALSGTGAVRTATFIPDADTDGGSASITIEAGAYADLAGNYGSAGATPSLHFDTNVPFAPSTPVLAAGSDTGASSTDNLTANDRPTFTGSAESGATVTLYDTNGSAIGSGTAVDGVWAIAPAVALANGAHAVSAQTVDAAGNASAFSAPLTITVDKTAPTLAITSDVASLKIGETAIVTFTFSEDPGSSFMRPDVSVEGGTIGALSGTGLTRMAVFTPGNGIDGGTASITVNGGDYNDAAGNAGGAGDTPVLRFDTKAPSAPSTPDLDAASDTGVSSTDNITADTTPTFSGIAEDGAKVTLYDGATAIGSAIAVDGTWRITSEAALQKGIHAISAIATDAAGNAGPASSALSIDVLTDGPATTVSGVALSSDSGSSGTDLVTRVAAQTISGALSAMLASGEHVEVSLDGGRNWVTAAAAPGDGDWALSTTLPAGTHDIQVKVVNAVGNGGPVLTQAYTLDTVAPGVTITSDVAQVKAGETATITFTFSEDPGSTFTRADVQVEGGTLGALSGSGLTRTAAFVPVAGIDGGVASITVTAGLYADLAGNAGSTGATPSLHFDTLAPSAPSAPVLAAGSDTGVSGTDNLTASDRPTFTGTAESGTGVTLYDSNGTVIGSGTAVDGVWSIVPTAALAEGAHTITAQAVDAAGNASAASSAQAVTIDKTAPTLVITGDVAQLKAGQTATITFTFSEDPGAGFDAASIGVEGGTLGELRGSGLTRTAVFTPTAGVDGGTASIRVNGGAYTDAAGNAGGVGLPPALSFDTLAPAAPAAPALAAASDTGTVGDGITTSTTQVIQGTGEANALVTLYDGERVAGSATAGADGKWSISATFGSGNHALSVTQSDAAGNVSAHSANFALTVAAPPAPTPAPGTLIDGVAVQTQPVTLPGGVAGTTISVPVVTGSRSETAGAAGVADIPLATSGGANLLLAQLPAGYGLSASGANVGVASGLEFLIASIKAATPSHAAGDQQHLTGNGQSFLAKLAASDALLVETVNPVSTTAPDGALVLSGQGAGAGQNVALVIDTGGLAAGSKLALKGVDFAAVIGAADVTSNDAGTILSGDAASQHFTVTAGSAGALFSGGGDDLLSFVQPQALQAASAAGHASANMAPTGDITTLHGGLGSDTARFSGARSDYDVEFHNGYVIVDNKATPNDKALVVNVEHLQFGDVSVAVEQNAALDTIAGMYQTVLGRQADLYGFEYWADRHDNGASWGAIALDMITSAEGETGRAAFNGNATHDIGLLYQALFNRAPDAAGLAFWQDAMSHGASLEQVATGMVGTVEMVGHQRAAADWDFLV